MNGVIVLIDPNDLGREARAASLTARGLRVISAGDERIALARLHVRGIRPDAFLVDALTPGLDTAQFVRSLADHPLGSEVPVILFVDFLTAPGVLPPSVHVMPRATPVHDLLAMLSALAPGDVPRPPVRLANGTGDLPALAATSDRPDLHLYAEAKLIQYLGAARAAATLDVVLRECALSTIETTADLHCVAQVLRTRGTIESAVAALLSGRATLIDSDRTLRSS